MDSVKSETDTGSQKVSCTLEIAAESMDGQATTTKYNWERMEVHFRTRAETKGHDGIVRFESAADLMEFLNVHLHTCSAAVLEKCLAAKERTVTDDWSWDDFKTVAMQCQDLASKTNTEDQANMPTKLCDDIWYRWQNKVFPLLNPAECGDESQMNLALVIIACLAEDVKPAIQDFIAKKHQQHHQITADDQDRETIAHNEFCSWLRQHYYNGICEYSIRQFVETNAVPHRVVNGTFHPFFTPASFTAATVEQLSSHQATATLAAKVVEIDHHLREEWKQLWSFVGLGDTHDQLDAATAFFAENYINHLLQVVAEDAREPPIKKARLNPRVEPTFDDNAVEANAREKLLQRCTEADLDKIDEMIKKLYKQENVIEKTNICTFNF